MQYFSGKAIVNTCRTSGQEETTAGQHLMTLPQNAQPNPAQQTHLRGLSHAHLVNAHLVNKAIPVKPLVHQVRDGLPLRQTPMPFSLSHLPLEKPLLPFRLTPLPLKRALLVGSLTLPLGKALLVDSLRVSKRRGSLLAMIMVMTHNSCLQTPGQHLVKMLMLLRVRLQTLISTAIVNQLEQR